MLTIIAVTTVETFTLNNAASRATCIRSSPPFASLATELRIPGNNRACKRSVRTAREKESDGEELSNAGLNTELHV